EGPLKVGGRGSDPPAMAGKGTLGLGSAGRGGNPRLKHEADVTEIEGGGCTCHGRFPVKEALDVQARVSRQSACPRAGIPTSEHDLPVHASSPVDAQRWIPGNLCRTSL